MNWIRKPWAKWGKASRNAKGEYSERIAEQYLCRQGLKLIARNYRCRWGEIDRVMMDQESLVFVEVRLRTHKAFTTPEVSVDRRKQSKLVRAAEHFLTRHPEFAARPSRFDVVAMSDTKDTSIRWFRNAFDTTGW